MNTLTVTFDVAGLTQAQIDSLIGAVRAQAESFVDEYAEADGFDQSRPEVPVVGVVVS